MKSIAKKIIWLISAFTMGCSAPLLAEKKEKISIIELMAHQEEYDGQMVRVEGYAFWGFENCVLIPANPKKSADAFKYSIWYSLSEIGCATGKYARDTKNGGALVEGVFYKDKHGHLGSYDASIINAHIVWEDAPDKPFP